MLFHISVDKTVQNPMQCPPYFKNQSVPIVSYSYTNIKFSTTKKHCKILTYTNVKFSTTKKHCKILT